MRVAAENIKNSENTNHVSQEEVLFPGRRCAVLPENPLHKLPPACVWGRPASSGYVAPLIGSIPETETDGSLVLYLSCLLPSGRGAHREVRRRP